MVILRGAANASLACCIQQARRQHRRLPNYCHLRSSGTSTSRCEATVANFSSANCHARSSGTSTFPRAMVAANSSSVVYGVKSTLFWGPNGRGQGLGFRIAAPCRAMCSSGEDQPDKSGGGLPRFHVESLPVLEGMVARVEGDEFSHMTKVLRLRVKDEVELFDGRGGVVNGQLSSISRTAAEVVTLENLQKLASVGPHWHVAAAFCTLKGGRGEWLVEKCTELGARTLTPLLTQRSSSVSGGRPDRWQRIALAATKQCQRLHSLEIEEPTLLQSFLPQVSRAEVAFVATAGAPPLYEMMSRIASPLQSGILFIGPEGDFTPDELNSLVSSGAIPVGLGPRRLRVETATVALLAAVMLMVETKASK